MMWGLAEMSYQFDEPFILDTTKFETCFGPVGTPLVAAAIAAGVLLSTAAAAGFHHLAEVAP